MPNNTENVTTKFRVDISDLKQNITEANKQIKLANAQFKNATAGMDDWSESADGLSAKIEQQNAIVDAEKKKLQALQQQLARLNAAQEKGERIIADLTEKYNEAVEAYGATSDEAKQYAKQLQDAQKAQQRNADAVEKLNLQIINQDTAVKNATAQADRYDAQLDELRRSTDYLKQRQADLTAEYEQAVAQYGRNSTEAARLSAELRDVSRELRNAENAAEDADGAAEKLEGGFTVAKAAIANFISDGINALLSKLGEAIQYLGTFGNEFDDAMNSFQASTGASAAEMAEFEESVKRIYNNNYGDGFEDIAAAMATVKQQAGDIGADELERMTTRAIMLRDTFDFDVNESIRTVEMMMQQFGVTSDEAFNLLAQGAQEGLDKNGDLLDTINEYSVHYRQQGYSAEEFFNSLKNGTEAGTFSVDKLGDAMKEFGIRAKDNSDSTRTAFADLGIAFDDNSEAIEKAGDKVQSYKDKIAKLQKNIQYAKIQQAGFTDSTNDLTKIKTADNIASWTEELNKYKSELSAAEQNLEDMQSAAEIGGMSVDDLSAKFAAGGDEAREATDQVMTALFAMDDQVKQNEIGVALFGTMWEDLGADGVKALLDVNGEINNTKDALSEIDRVKYDSVGNAIQGIRRNLETGILMPISDKLLPKIQELSDKFADWLNDPKTQAKIQEFSDKFADFAENGIDKVVTAFSWIIDHKDGIIAAITGIAAGFVAFKVVSTVQAAITALEGLAAVIELVGVKQAITNAIMAANPIGLIIAAIAGLVSAFVYLWKNNEGFREFWINLWETLKEKCGAAWEAIKGFFSAAWEYIKTVWGAVSAWFNERVVNPVKNFFAGLWNSVKAAASTAWAFIKGVWQTVSGWFNSTIIQPVSKFFSGMWEKLKSGAKDAWEGIKTVFGVVSDWFKNTFADAWQKVKDVFSTGGKVFEGIKDGIVSAFKTVVNAIIRGINRVIAVPFNAINGILDRISNVDIAGFRPFSGLITRLPVPQIPQLAQGGIVDKRTLATIGEDGAEAVLPLDKNKGGLKKIAKLLAGEMKSGGAFGGNGNGGGKTQGGDTIYNFNQTNNSPKSLSRYDIYRQTKNLMNALKIKDPQGV